jgi:hypothetical protein
MVEALSACGSERRRSESNRRMEVLQFYESRCETLGLIRNWDKTDP